jgi:hypothetical protein
MPFPVLVDDVPWTRAVQLSSISSMLTGFDLFVFPMRLPMISRSFSSSPAPSRSVSEPTASSSSSLSLALCSMPSFFCSRTPRPRFYRKSSARSTQMLTSSDLPFRCMGRPHLRPPPGSSPPMFQRPVPSPAPRWPSPSAARSSSVDPAVRRPHQVPS